MGEVPSIRSKIEELFTETTNIIRNEIECMDYIDTPALLEYHSAMLSFILVEHFNCQSNTDRETIVNSILEFKSNPNLCRKQQSVQLPNVQIAYISTFEEFDYFFRVLVTYVTEELLWDDAILITILQFIDHL